MCPHPILHSCIQVGWQYECLNRAIIFFTLYSHTGRTHRSVLECVSAVADVQAIVSGLQHLSTIEMCAFLTCGRHPILYMK